MNLTDLKARGAIVSAAPVTREVTWEHDDPTTGEKVTDKFTVEILRHSYGTMERLYMIGEDRSKGAAMIAECVRFGGEAMSYEDAYQLHPGLATALLTAITEANDVKN